MSKYWRLAPDLEGELKNEFKDFSPLLGRLLFNRGLNSLSLATDFLIFDYDKGLADPFLFSDMEKAVLRIWQAIDADEKIVIFGDYDADGVPATVILAEFFQKIGFNNFLPYIPDRYHEGYSLNEKAIKKFAEAGAKLIITVDCGITAVAEVALARSLGIEVIITDHHLVAGALPEAYAIIDAKKEDDQYPYKHLSGAGVAFQLIRALLSRRPDLAPLGWEKWLLDLVAISTVSDMVPLTGENRILVHFGLRVLRQTRRVGLWELFRQLKLKQGDITEDDLGFSIGPRINSAGRMSHASEAYELLITSDPVLAKNIVTNLEKNNHRRREAVDEILAWADKNFSGREDLPPVLVLGEPTWPLGVLGLASARLVEKFSRPVFVWGLNSNGEAKGSCRSDGSINMVELMGAVSEGIFSDYGGHHHAGGYSLPAEQVATLEKDIVLAFEDLPKKEITMEIIADMELDLREINNETYGEIERLAPFGIENPKPIFWFKNLELKNARAFGRGGAHLELTFLNHRGQLIKAIGFFACLDLGGDGQIRHRFGEVDLTAGRRVDLLANLEKTTWCGRKELRLRIIDIH